MKETFDIIALHILPNCSENIRKVLKEDKWYFFNQKYKQENGNLIVNEDYFIPNGFFSDKINIQAIVGKNGSGKSTVIEVMLRIINNIASLLLTNADIDTELCFVSDVYAELFYEIDGAVFSLKCENSIVSIMKGDETLDFNTYQKLFHSYDNQTLTLEEAKPHLKELFFTIVNNYSFHAYNEYDFLDEAEDMDHLWIRGVFHKNDGYLTPIVLNPYRDFGKIDIEREKQLTNSRLALLFYSFYKEGKDFIPDYKFKYLTFKLNEAHINRKYYIINPNNPKDRKKVVVTINKEATDVFNTTLKCYYSDYIIDEKLELAYKYLVYKTFSISNKYPNYRDFIDRSLVEFCNECTDRDKAEIQILVNKIQIDSSHTTIKIRQTLKYIDFVCSVIKNKFVERNDFYQIEEDYIGWPSTTNPISEELTNFDKLLSSFPPPFYNPTIGLQSDKGDNVVFERMSSGERQFLFYLSTILYHIKNLDSVIDDKESVHYNNVNIVLEEVELYFHPEYQKQFISRLINYLEIAKFENIKHFNIIIATHSPFILSDIPEYNIMFLEDGVQINDSVNLVTFGANIHDLLRHGFFMKSGTMGDFAKIKIEAIVDEILEMPISSSRANELFKLIEIIGEPVLQERLVFMLQGKMNIKTKDVIIKELLEEVKFLKSKI